MSSDGAEGTRLARAVRLGCAVEGGGGALQALLTGCRRVAAALDAGCALEADERGGTDGWELQFDDDDNSDDVDLPTIGKFYPSLGT